MKNNKKAIYKTNKRLILSIFIITVTTFLINFFSVINKDDLPEAFNYLKFIFDEKIKFYVFGVLLIINILFGYIPLFHFFSIGGQKWIIKKFIPTIFYSLFGNKIQQLKSPNNQIEDFKTNWYRVTCYRYISFETCPFTFVFEYIKRRFHRVSKDRYINFKNGYLVCFYRYGMEDGKVGEDYTSMIYQVKSKKNLEDEENIKGISGLTFISDLPIKKALDFTKINEILKKIIDEMKRRNIMHILYNDTMLQKSKTDNIEQMKSVLNQLNNNDNGFSITDDEKNIIIDFMNKTNTDFNAMFGISNGHHSNHFVGFKINTKSKSNTPWGVIVIDAYEKTPESFWKIISSHSEVEPDDNFVEEWLNFVINSYMEVLSNTTTEIIFNKEG